MPSVAVSGRRARAALAVALTALVALMLTTTRARADYQGPDENASEANGPITAGTPYSATLNQNGTNPDDQDWYSYNVSVAGEKLHWTVTNTSSGCTPNPLSDYCHVYATLEDASGNQLGGSNSSAGTAGALPGQTQTINWTFTSPGKYYIAFVGDGDVLGYRFSFTSSTPTVTPSLNLKAHQGVQRRFVVFSLTVPAGGARLGALLHGQSNGTSFLAGTLGARNVGGGTRHLAIRLDNRAWSALTQHHRLSVTLNVTLTRSSAPRLEASRKLLLR